MFNTFRERLHEYTLRLYDAYIEHYVKKNAKPLKEYDRELKTHMYKLHYDVFLATMKEAGTFVTKHTVINYVNNLAAAQQLACLNGASAGVSLPTSDNAVAVAVEGSGAGTGTGTGERRRFLPSKGRHIERSSSSDARSGFRIGRPTRGRSMPTLTIQIPSSSDTGVDAGAGVGTVKGSKTSGSVKVHNQFAGLDVDM